MSARLPAYSNPILGSKFQTETARINTLCNKPIFSTKEHAK